MALLRGGALALVSAGAWLVLAPSQAQGQKRQKDLIAREEIESSPKRSDYIYDVIRSARPHFLEAPRGVRRTGIDPAGPGAPRPAVGMGGSSQPQVEVFVELNHVGGIDVLKNILAEEVEEVRYFDPSRAEAEFGLTLGAGGAIVIKMYKPKPPEKKPTSPE
jgi:hypothetical protein